MPDHDKEFQSSLNALKKREAYAFGASVIRRHAWHLLCPTCKRAVEVAEAYAAGNATTRDLDRVGEAVRPLRPLSPLVRRHPRCLDPTAQAIKAAWAVTGDQHDAAAAIRYILSASAAQAALQTFLASR